MPTDTFDESRLVNLLTELSPEEGMNETAWPGLAVYRFETPVQPHWDEVGSLSLCVVGQGKKIVTVDGTGHLYDPYRYLVLTRAMHLQAEILTASPEKPFLSLVLQIPSALVAEVLVEIHASANGVEAPQTPQQVPDAFVSAMERQLQDAVIRFVSAAGSAEQRRLLCPMILREIVFHLLQHKQAARLRSAAVHEASSHRVLVAIRYMEENLERKIDVAEIAGAAGMSPSSFARRFKTVTQVSPIRFLKNLRLKKARSLLLKEGCAASEAAYRVGYMSPSQFSREFKRRFGESPSSYLNRFRRTDVLDV